MKLSDLISQKTKTVDPPAGNPPVEKVLPVEKKQEPIIEVKKTEIEKVADSVSEADIILAGEINTDLFCAGVETPLVIYNSVASKKKKKKAKLTMKGEVLAARLKEIDEWKKANEEVIYVEGKEYDRLKSAFTKLARLNKGKPSEGLMIGGAIVSTLAKRVEIFFE